MSTDLGRARLATILAALDGAPRNPANREAALRAITKSAERLGLTALTVLAASPSLLDGRLDPAAWRAGLTGAAAAEPGAEAPEAVETAEPVLAADTAAPAAEARAAAPEPTVAPASMDEEESAEPAGEDGTTAAAAPAAVGATPARQPRRPREGSKEALVVAMLERPEGATVEQIMAATGWQRHTVRGAFAGALKKKLGLAVTSAKEDGGRIYRIVRAA